MHAFAFALIGVTAFLSHKVNGFRHGSNLLRSTKLVQMPKTGNSFEIMKESPLLSLATAPTLRTAMQLSSSASTTTSSEGSNGLWAFYQKTMDFLTILFPLWTVLFAGLAIVRPESFAWFNTNYFTWFLGALMLSMGITLTPADFVRVAQEPAAVIVGFLFCYVFCPLLGLALGKAFKLPLDLTAGLVLIGAVNGGQASNLCTYIAKGDVALSVLMTTVTTIAGIFMTPLLCKALLGAVVPVDAAGIAISCMQVVLAPIVLGMTANKFLPKVVSAILPITPVIGVASTCLLVASAIAQCASSIVSAGWGLQIPVMIFHLLSGIAGYYIPKAMKFTETQSRTMAIETAMKSSAFGFLLAKLHFKQYAARIPAAVSVVWMALIGASMAVVWRFIPVKEDE
jgi:BASS family bile acid:Na+ symporter